MIRCTVILCTFLSILFAASPQTVMAEKPTIIGGEIIVNIDAANNSGSTWVHLRNDTRSSMKVFLHVGDFISQTTQKKISANVIFQQAESTKTSPFFEGELTPGSLLFLRLEISNFAEAGEAHAQLFDRDTKLTTVKAVKFNIPFGISLDVADPSHPELAFQKGRPGLLVFKNEDPMTYPVEWSLLLPESGHILGKSREVIPARSTLPVEISLPHDVFTSWFSGFFKDQVEEGRLVLRFTPPGDVGQLASPVKAIPVKLKKKYWSSGWQSFVSNAVILIVLIMGGLFSLFLNLWIPNKLQRIELLRRIDKLADKTKTISTKIDSSLRVGARVERLRLAELIRSVWFLNTDASKIFEGYKSEINLLDQRVSLIQELDTVTGILDGLRGKIAEAPAKILDDVSKRLEEATELLKLSAPEETHFQRAQQIIRGVDEGLRKITNEDPKFAEQLAAWVVMLKQEYDGPLKNLKKCQELRPKLKELFNLFDTEDYKDKSKILPVHYHWLSSTIERLFVLRHYIQAWENATGDEQDRIKSHEEELLKYLKIRTWNALCDARRLRFEIEESIFAEDVIKELAKEAISIDRVPIQPLPNQSVRLEVQFNNKGLNTCTARQEFSCVWDFGKVGKEEGWEISHYFRKQDEAQFSVSFRGHDGKMVKRNDSPEEVKVSPTPPLQLQEPVKRQYGERWRIEAIRLSVVLIVAVLGLIAGAKDQLLKLDVFSGLVGVFLLGFGADTVKNIITKRPSDEA
jgi:HAMP domain-containing protein